MSSGHDWRNAEVYVICLPAELRPHCVPQKVLANAGVVPAGPALGGRPGTWYQRDLAAGIARSGRRWGWWCGCGRPGFAIAGHLAHSVRATSPGPV
jgi:hypothetical protein